MLSRLIHHNRMQMETVAESMSLQPWYKKWKFAEDVCWHQL